MPEKWRETVRSALLSLRNLLLGVVIVAAIEGVASLVVWAVLFRTLPLGVPMALTLIGFGGWLLSFLSSMGAGRRRMATGTFAGNMMNPFAVPQFLARRETSAERKERFGCGLVLFFASVIPLGVAFYMRVQADFRLGRTWSDIFYVPR